MKNCKDKGFRHEYYECICNDADHVLRISYFVDADGNIEDGELFAEIMFRRAGFFGRIWRALKYIFKFRSEPGWATWVVEVEGAKELRLLLDKLILSSEKAEEESKHHPYQMPSSEGK